ncbi:DUF1573 domain-containing protein [Chryseobacterium sp. T1]
MKKAFFTFLAIAGFGLVSAQTISFDKTTLEYGDVKTGSDGHRFFTVKNTGTKPLILNDIKPQCGCTTPEWSKNPILPGKTGQIKVGYNTELKGSFKKLIEVYSNDPDNERTVIWIQGNVVDNAQEAAPALSMKASSVEAESKSAKKQVAASKK